MAMGVMRPAMFTALLTSVVLAVGCSVVTAASSSAGGGDFRGLAWAYVVAMYAQMGALVLVSWKLEVGCEEDDDNGVNDDCDDNIDS